MASEQPPPTKRSKSNDDHDTVSATSTGDYAVRETSRSVARRYGMEVFNFEARMMKPALKNKRLLDITDSLRAMFQEMLDKAGHNYSTDDRVRMHIEHSGLQVPMVIHIQPKHNVTADTVMDR